MRTFRTKEEIDDELDETGNLVVIDDVTIECDVEIDGDIKCRNIDCYNLTCRNLTCRNLICRNLTCHDLDCCNLGCYTIACHDLHCLNITCYSLICDGSISYYAFCIAYDNIICQSIAGTRNPCAPPICLDGKLTIREIIRA